jgi:hypothetical protein
LEIIGLGRRGCVLTYAEAAAHARHGNKVVRFRSPEWTALRAQAEPAAPILGDPLQENVTPRGEGETLFEAVLRLCKAYGFDEAPERGSDMKRGSVYPAGVQSIGSQADNWVILESNERSVAEMYALLEAMEYRFHILLISNIGRHS